MTGYPPTPLPYPPYGISHPYSTYRASDFHHDHVEAHYRTLLSDCESALENRTPVYVRGQPGVVVDIVDRYIGDRGTFVAVAMQDGNIINCRVKNGGELANMPFARIAA